MDRDIDRYRCLTRRSLVLGGLKLGLLGALAGRLYYLQVIEAEHYRVLAEENRINLRLLPPSRGLIVDRFGVSLAENVQNFQVVLVPEQAGAVPATLEKLSAIVPLSEADIARVLRETERHPHFVPITVSQNLMWDQVARLEVNAPELPGLSIDVGELRRYPFGEATAHVLGYVGAVSQSELTEDPLLKLPGFRIGKNGVEKEYDLALRGSAGASRVEVNSVGRIIRELSRDEGTPGEEVRLALDIGLQSYVQQRLKSELSASAVVLDVHSGEVLALASHPSFDPNLFPTGIDAASWRGLLEDPYHPLTNKVIAGQYPPGSTFKMVVALAALEAGLGPEHTAYCPGHVSLGSHRFHCWKRGGHGTLDMVEAISQSCDVYFYDLSRRVGIDRIAAMASRFGFGEVAGIDMPGERRGLMPTSAWKRGAIGEAWQPGETLVAAIGQGYVSATPLQLVVMLARMVNGGRAIRPRLRMAAADPTEADAAAPIDIPEAQLAVMRQGMEAVTKRGTARLHQIQEEGMEMGGKTGTSQVRRITMAERAAGRIRQEDRPWRYRHHGLFVGYAPIHAPRYACCVVVEHGGSSAVAAPIARDILHETQRRSPAGAVSPAPMGPSVALPPATHEG